MRCYICSGADMSMHPFLWWTVRSSPTINLSVTGMQLNFFAVHIYSAWYTSSKSSYWAWCRGHIIASHNYVIGYLAAEETVVQFSPARLPYTESFLAGSVTLVVALCLSILLSSLVEVRSQTFPYVSWLWPTIPMWTWVKWEDLAVVMVCSVSLT